MAVIEAVKRSSKLREWTEVVTLTEEPDPNPVLSAAVRRSTIAAVWSLFPNEFYLQFQEEQIDSFLKILTPSWRNLNKKAVLSWRFVMTFTSFTLQAYYKKLTQNVQLIIVFLWIEITSVYCKIEWLAFSKRGQSVERHLEKFAVQHIYWPRTEPLAAYDTKHG